MDLMEALRGRRAVRGYSAEGVSRATVADLIEAAIWAPSAMNEQPWAFVVVEGDARLTGFSDRAKRVVLDSLTADSPLARYREHLEDAAFQIFYHAPVLVVVCATQAVSQAEEDCCLAAQNLMLEAHARGLGTCWIGFARAWLNRPEIKAELGIPAAWSAVAPLVIGHAKAAPAPTSRNAATVIWSA